MTDACPLSSPDRRSGGMAGRLVRRLKGLPEDKDGSMALEYALIAPAFIALILGILHVALIYFAQEGLETTVEGAARIMMTGQAQTIIPAGQTYTGLTGANFKTAICQGLAGQVASTNSAGVVTYSAATIAKSLPPFLACDRLAVNVEIVPSSCTSPTITTPNYTWSGSALTGAGFGAVTCTGSWSSSSTATDSTQQNQLKGTQGQLVILQLAYAWPTTSVPMGFNLVNLSNGNRLLLATYAFTVEGYLCKDGTTTSC